MRFLPLLLLPFLTTPAIAGRLGPGTQLGIDRINSNSARLVVTNSGGMRGKFTMGAFDASTGESVPVGIGPRSNFSLSANRSRKVRFTNLPQQPLLLCATVEASPSLDLRSCVQFPRPE